MATTTEASLPLLTLTQNRIRSLTTHLHGSHLMLHHLVRPWVDSSTAHWCCHRTNGGATRSPRPDAPHISHLQTSFTQR